MTEELDGGFVAHLRRRVAAHPERIAFVFLADDEAPHEALSYGELDRRARALAAVLAARAGGVVLLLFAPGLAFIVAFLACLYAGKVAIPAYPPRGGKKRRDARLLAILEDAAPDLALTSSALHPRLVELARNLPELAALELMATDGEEPGDASAWVMPELGPDSLAFLQYTSGSTSQPKGVMVSHGNLAANEAVIQRAFGIEESSVIVGWLPLFHDMGLIGNVLQPLFAGARCILLSPSAFLQRPLSWLDAVSCHRATVSGGPNFAYELCLRRLGPELPPSLDLSSWVVAFNGAEPVRAPTIAHFSATFAACGLRPTALYPCYGLAEATLFVTGGEPGRAPRTVFADGDELTRGRYVEGEPAHPRTRALVSCGRPPDGQPLWIVDAASGRRCEPGEVGEIWVAGPSVARGYFRNAAASEATFGARPGDGGGPFLRTGDLGFLAAGELFVVGRSKELLILRGRNHYPQDLEATATAAHPALSGQLAAAFGIEGDGEETLTLVVEADREPGAGGEAIAAAVRGRLADEHEVTLRELILVRKGSIPRTTSGKIQRLACREAWQRGELPILAQSSLAPPSADRAATAECAVDEDARRGALRREVGRILGRPAEAIDPRQPLSGYGLDSLAAMEIQAAVTRLGGAEPPYSALLEGATISDLAALLAGASPPVAAARPAAEAAELPLTEGQRGLWLAEQSAPGRGVLNIAVAGRIEGHFDAAAFRRALAGLVARHAALRTTFPRREGRPVQRIACHGGVDFVQEDAADASPEGVARRLTEEAFRPFDLEDGPLFRVRVFASPAGQAVLLVSIHHLIADFWSLAQLARELGRLYDAELEGEGAITPSPCPAGPWDLLAAESEELASPAVERLWEYWRRELAGELPLLDLPLDRPRRTPRSGLGRGRSIRLGSEVSAAVQALAHHHRATLFAVLLAGYAATLGRFCGQREVVIGTPSAGRRKPGAVAAVGYAVNPLPLRLDASGRPSFSTLIARARSAARGALDHAGLPFTLLAEALAPGREQGRSPLFQTLFVMQQGRDREGRDLAGFALGRADARLRLGRLELAGVELGERRAQLDLTLIAAPTERGIDLLLEVDAELFDATTAERFLRSLAALIAAASAAPERGLESWSLLSPAERHQTLCEWSVPSCEEPPAPALLHARVVDTARAVPDAIALVAGEARLSYAALERWAATAAAGLEALGVAPEEPVGVCLPRSFELVVAILGVLAAGGAFLPLDVDYPEERKEHLLADSGARLLIAESAARGDGRRAVTMAELAARAGSGGGGWEARLRRQDPDQLAYVIYTSGSTGEPKGVMVAHGSIHEIFTWRQREFPLAGNDAVLQAVSCGFDAALWELFAPLLGGARLVLAAPGEHLDAGRLADLLVREGITVFQRPPSLLAPLLDALPTGSDRIRHVICGGEPLPAGLPDMLRTRSRARLHNLYGPAEACLDATAWPCATGLDGRTLPIGRPVARQRVHLLDRSLRPVLRGAVGEICIGGASLARGYLGRPAWTAARFQPSAFATAGARLYRTGDLGRWLPSGDLEFQGRLDSQVKIRGCRVEPGEVEAALRAVPGVRHAAVMYQPAAAGREEGRLLGFFSTEPGVSLAAGEARAALQRQLPAHMVPQRLTGLAALPLTPHGKIDLRALPAAEERERLPGRAPRTPSERVVAAAWEAVLAVEGVGLDDDFFDLGGHSLSATRVLAELRRTAGCELPLRLIFEAPTLEALARRLDAIQRQAPALPPLLPRAAGETAPASFAQARLLFLERLTPASAAYHLPGTLRLCGRPDVARLARALSVIEQRHEALRTVFLEDDGEIWQRILPPSRPRLPTLDLAHLGEGAGSELALALAVREAARPFDLGRERPLRVTLLRLGPELHHLLFTAHHAASDGWSTGIFLTELAELDRALRGGRPAALAPLEVGYPDFAVWQRRYLSSPEAFAPQLDYWRGQLTGSPQSLELTLDRPRPADWSFRGGRHPLHWPSRWTAGLEELGRRSNATLFMTLLAGFQLLLCRLSGQREVTVGTPVDGRSVPGTEGIIGLFVNTVVMRGGARRGETFGAFVERVRETVLDAHAHQDLPFERLVDALGVERDLGRAPLFQTLFVLADRRWESVALEGLEVEVLERASGCSKFDLTLSLVERADGLAGYLEYASDLFDAATIARLAAALAVLLESATELPTRPALDLPLLSPAQERQIAAATAAAPVGGPAAGWIHERIVARLVREPEAIVANAGEEHQSAAALAASSAELAARLASEGVGPESLVAVLITSPLARLAGLLGVWRAGGAYLPLDPGHPEARLAELVADSGARQVVVDGEPAAALVRGRRVIRLAALAPPAAAERRAVELLPESLAYVLYTSGSTGAPKGVEVDHGSLARQCRAMEVFYGLGPEDRVLQTAAPSFDPSLEQSLTALACGARLVLRPGLAALSELGEHLAEQRISVVNPTPAVWLEWIATLDPSQPLPSALRLVNVGGELISRAAVSAWRRVGSGVRLLNSYGPTEATITATAAELGPAEPLPSRSAPIGRPHAGRAVHVLDAALRPLPVSVAGDLYLGGLLARGYRGQPRLTAERFLPDPFAVRPGERLYRTGDRARLLHDLQLEFLGRRDHQIKVRGVRIEPGEIEAALLRHPRVLEAVARAVPGSGGASRLTAYVRAPEAPPSAEELRHWLLGLLPEVMIPSAFVVLPAFPRTASGKLDRGALPLPEVRPRGESRPPTTAVEASLVRLWQEVLQVPAVGVDDNFFELGGDSILSIRIVSRAARLGLSLTPKLIFQHPTIAELAPLATAMAEPAATGPAVGPLPLLPIQRAFLAEPPPDPNHFNQALLLRGRRELPAGALARAASALAAHHDALRLRVVRAFGDWRAHLLPPGSRPPFVLLDVSHLAPADGDRALAAAVEGLQRSLDLAAGPIYRLALVRRGTPAADRLAFVVHHLAVDAVSWQILIEDLECALGQLGRGEAIALAGKTTSIQDWARLVDGRRRTAVQRPPLPPLPVDFDGVADTLATADSVALVLGAADTAALQVAASGLGPRGLDALLLAAVGGALARWSGRPTLALDLESHGRDAAPEGIDLSRTVGWLTRVDRLRAELPPAPLARLQALLAALEGVGEGGGEESTARPQVAFNNLGRIGADGVSALFEVAPEGSGTARDPAATRPYLFELTASSSGGRLSLSWGYGQNRHRRQTVEQLVAQTRAELGKLVDAARAWAPAASSLSSAPRPAVPGAAAIPAVGRERPLPLSFAQQRLWFMQQLAPASPAYNIPLGARLKGRLEVRRLALALAAVVARHEALRTRFEARGHEVLQVIARHLCLSLPVIDLSALAPTQAARQAERLARAEAWRGFDLARWPLVRCRLLRLSAAEHDVLFTAHHIIADGWSMGLLMNEVAALYDPAGRPPPPLPIQYADFAVWQRAHLEGPVLERLVEHWRGTLAGAPTVLDLRGDRARPERPSEQGGLESGALPEALSRRVRSFARAERLTPFIVLFSAYQVLLHHLSGQLDLVVGTPGAGRDRPEIEGLFGCFVNLIALRTRLDGDPSFSTLLRRTAEVAADAFSHQELPFEKLVEELKIPRQAAGSPLVQVVFTFENVARGLPAMSGLELELHAVDFNTTLFDLALIVEDSERGLITSMRYRSDLFSAARIRHLLAAFERLLETVLNQPESRLSELVGALAEGDRERRLEGERELAEAGLRKLKLARRRAVAEPLEESLR